MKTSSDNIRIGLIDFLKFIAIFLVVWAHQRQILFEKSMFSSTLSKVIYSFHMPFFMTLSGFFAENLLKYSFILLLKQKFIRVLLPAICWSVPVILYYFFWSGKYVSVGEALRDFLTDYWFLKSIFFCYLLFFISVKLFKKKVVACLISCLILFLLPDTKIHISFMLPFFWLGYFLKTSVFSKEKMKWGYLLALFSAFVALLFAWKLKYTIYITPMNLIDWNELTLNYSALWIAIYRFLLGLSGTVVVLSLAKRVYEKWGNTKTMSICESVGKETLAIYLFHIPFLRLVSPLLYPIPRAVNGIFFDFVIAPLLTLLTLSVSMLVVYLLRSNDLTSLFLLGETKKRV